jgi:hypothetical protein
MSLNENLDSNADLVERTSLRVRRTALTVGLVALAGASLAAAAAGEALLNVGLVWLGSDITYNNAKK